MKGKGKIAKIAIISTVVALLVTFGLIVFAQRNDSSKATVLNVEGFVDVKIKGTSKAVALVEGMKVGVGDVITTDSESSVKLKLNDGSVIKIGGDSIVVIKELQFEVTKVSKSSFELIKGKIRAVVNPFLDKNSKFTIETENASIGVRGTDFGASFNIDLGETNIISIKDCVSVVAKKFPSLDPIDVCTRKELLISGGDAPGDVVGVDEEKLEEFLEEMNLADEWKATTELEVGLDSIEPPVITSAFLNNRIDLEDVEDALTLTKSDLNFDGKVLVAGSAEDGKYLVSKVEVSVDDGMTWGVASGTDRWTFSFKPELGTEYELMIRAANEKGVISDPGDFGTFTIKYLDVSYDAIAKTFIDSFFRYVKSSDSTGLGDLISDNYDGKAGGGYSKDEILDENLEEFFDQMQSMTISYTINQVSFDGTSIVVSTSWTASLDGETSRGTTKWWLSQSENYTLVHTEGSWFTDNYIFAGTPELTVELVSIGTPVACPDGVKIMLFAPKVPRSIDSVIVQIDVNCDLPTEETLTRDFYEKEKGRKGGFGGKFHIYDTTVPTCVGVPAACIPLEPFLYYGAADRSLKVSYSEYGCDLMETIMMP
jgi:FecR protein